MQQLYTRGFGVYRTIKTAQVGDAITVDLSPHYTGKVLRLDRGTPLTDVTLLLTDGRVATVQVSNAEEVTYL